MSKIPLSTIGLIMPIDFPSALYESVHARAVAKKDQHPDSWVQFSGAWNAIAYRFLSCTEHDTAFTNSISQTRGDAPPQPERYFQERDLFGFFFTGLSSIECLYYALFAIGSIVDATRFPMGTAQQLRNISPRSTSQQYNAAFPSEPLSFLLNQLITSMEFLEWTEIRNILAHRSSPPRQIFRSIHVSIRNAPHTSSNSVADPSPLWLNGIQLDSTTTSSRRTWLVRTLGDVIQETETFISTHF